jgi:hypothetical protein
MYIILHLFSFLFHNFAIHTVDRYSLQKQNGTTFNISISLICLTPPWSKGMYDCTVKLRIRALEPLAVENRGRNLRQEMHV